MEAKKYLEKIGITDRVLNREDLPQYWKSISQLMEEYAALHQPHVIKSVCGKCGKRKLAGYQCINPITQKCDLENEQTVL
jgi:uncharacterized OB-fold protein